MQTQLHHLLEYQLPAHGQRPALSHKSESFTYEALFAQVCRVAGGLKKLGITKGERVGIYLPKTPEAVQSLFGASAAGAVFVPINPLLKPAQVQHILNDCNVSVLITSEDRTKQLSDTLAECKALRALITIGKGGEVTSPAHIFHQRWSDFTDTDYQPLSNECIDTDVAAILYTSGSTGKPKGVVLSHRNMICGAHSVAQYLANHPDDRILAVLPFSFDYGLSQLTTAFSVGASVILMDYLLPRDVIRAVERYQITGLAAVPPLWNQLANLEWPEAAATSLRYLTNSGGAMPKATTARLRAALPKTQVFLMYGLTEAFRSTYLPPDQLDVRPESMGKAIPNAQVMVVREDGSECAPHEPGELVHRGSLVAMGYWNDPAKTSERFKPAPDQNTALPITELAVWSGDQVYRDEEGFLYFVSRKDEMIKTSGYRVSPTEIEECLYQSGLVDEVAALGAPHPTLGQGIVVLVKTKQSPDDILKHCKQELPNYMQPQHLKVLEEFPKNPNGKLDRSGLKRDYQQLFEDANS